MWSEEKIKKRIKRLKEVEVESGINTKIKRDELNLILENSKEYDYNLPK